VKHGISRQPPDLILEPLLGPEQIASLEADAKADGRAMVTRLIAEWEGGENRFALRGEGAYVARMGTRICAVGGLNRDPYARDASIGRIRRLYVSPKHRRNGIGTALVEKLLSHARGVYCWAHLRTHDPEAAAFYEAIGFERVSGNAECTHRRAVVT
jgi:GNAT superfamily N-acetyltransferase